MKVISMMGLKVILASKRMFHEAGVKLVQLPYEIDVETKSVSVKSIQLDDFLF